MPKLHKIGTLGILALAGTGLALIATRPAFADADVAKEIATASAHAGLALAATDMKTTQMHLHHVVNCLVGPKGTGFDGSFGNPCTGQGDGAITDNKDTMKTPALSAALSQANAGLKTTDMAEAHKDAAAIQAALKPAM